MPPSCARWSPSPSSFLVNTGDFVENGGSAAQWQTFFDIEAPLTRERPIFSCVGNHELVDGAGIEYVRYFGPAELPKAVVAPGARRSPGVPLHDAAPAPLSLDQLSGTFRWSNARFFCVNGMVSYTSGATRAWLEKVLARLRQRARPRVAHRRRASRAVVERTARRQHAASTTRTSRSSCARTRSISSSPVTITSTSAGVADGLSYLVSGGGGAPVYRVKKAGPTSRRYESVRHFIEASVSAVAIQFVATRPDGSTIERCALRKSDGWDCDGDKAATRRRRRGGRTGCVVGVERRASRRRRRVAMWLSHGGRGRRARATRRRGLLLARRMRSQAVLRARRAPSRSVR